MSKFNIKKTLDTTILSCKLCEKLFTLRKVYNGCPSCGYHLLKIAHRGNLEKSNPYNQIDQKDPYLRQKDNAAIDSSSGRGGNLTKPNDEDSSGGLGSRFRGKLFPRDFSQDSDKYEEQRKNDIPGSKDTLLDNPPLKTDLDGWFADPDDPLSTRRQYEERKKFPTQSLEGNLRKQRLQSNSILREMDDNIFSRISKKQKGVLR